MDESSPNYSKIMSYIDDNPAAVLSTTNEDGSPHGAVIYVCTASHHAVCFVTKTLTQKYKNFLRQPKVSITFFKERETSTLQTTGQAFLVEDPKMLQYVIEKIAKIHAMQADWMPPISKLEAGDYAIIGVELDSARLAEYKGVGITGENIFTEF